MLLTDASVNLFTRPMDEHFASFPELMQRCHTSRQAGREVPSDAKRILFLNRNDKLSVVVGDDHEVVPTAWSLSQIAASCRVPVYVLEQLKTDTAVRVLNETYPRSELSERLALVENGRLRALTSSSYSRLWDVHVLGEIHRWLLPDGRFVPAMPTVNTDQVGTNLRGNNKPALFRGDRDSFTFFYSSKRPGDDGLGGLRKGIVVYNSEVGARSFGYETFYFREMCANFLIWDARQVVRRRAIHKGSLDRVFREFKLDLIEASAEIEQHELDVFRRAAEISFAGDGSPTKENREAAEERLQREFGATKTMSRRAVEAALNPENPGDLSLWGIANGFTSIAKLETWAGSMADLSVQAGRVLALAQ
ncbi:MAG: hypothetical protein HZB39_12160 [Planctomycetes bacterium]|nr:hypothetical protein [Planctomycetota bacterium]